MGRRPVQELEKLCPSEGKPLPSTSRCNKDKRKNSADPDWNQPKFLRFECLFQMRHLSVPDEQLATVSMRVLHDLTTESSMDIKAQA